jgi:hypothetical protein
MKYLLCFVLLLPCAANAQIITTVAGGGTGGDGSKAILAKLNDPTCLAFDRYGNLYITEPLNNDIRKIDTNGIITTVAGNGSAGFSGDGGPAVSARLREPVGITCDDSGNVYFVDEANHRIRKISVNTGIITTVVGNGTAGGLGAFGGDGGRADTAKLNFPNQVCFDKLGNLYISDNVNNRIRKVNKAGTITTVVGTGVHGHSGDGGPASSAEIINPGGIIFDHYGNMFLTDSSLIRKVDTNGLITTFAGSVSSGIFNGDGILASSARLIPCCFAIAKNGDLLVSDSYNHRIRSIDSSGIVNTVAGNGGSGYSGDGGPADSAQIDYNNGIALDRCGNLYIAHVNTPRIRLVKFYPQCDSTQHHDTTGVVNTTALTREITIYPNPVQNQLTIASTNKIQTITITNTMGQTVYTNTVNTNKAVINIQSLEPGLYFTRVNNYWVQKFLKE